MAGQRFPRVKKEKEKKRKEKRFLIRKTYKSNSKNNPKMES